MLIKEEKYIYVIKITRLICVDNIITVGAHVLSSNPASLASPGSVNLNTLIAGVEGRAGNALPTAVSKLLIMHLASLIHGSHSLVWSQHSKHQPWEHRSTCPPLHHFRNFPFAAWQFQTSMQNLLQSFQSFSPELPHLEISKIKSFPAYVQLIFSSLRNWTS